jgi:hypothetical protein
MGFVSACRLDQSSGHLFRALGNDMLAAGVTVSAIL